MEAMDLMSSGALAQPGQQVGREMSKRKCKIVWKHIAQGSSLVKHLSFETTGCNDCSPQPNCSAQVASSPGHVKAIKRNRAFGLLDYSSPNIESKTQEPIFSCNLAFSTD